VESPLFWSSLYCTINGQSSIESTFDFGMESHEFRFIYDINNASLKSPGRATFGGIWISAGIPTHTYFINLYQSLFEQLRIVDQINVTLPPEYFYPEIFLNQSKALEACGFEKKYTDHNFHVDLPLWTPANLSKGNRKKIRQFADAGGEIVLGSDIDFVAAYEVLRKNRENRGVKISMDREKFIKNIFEFPGNYKIYLAKVKSEIAAVAYVVRLSEQVNYVLFWGDDTKFRHLSPVASLLKFLISVSREEGCKVLDLGISSVDGVLDDGLARFKSNLGAIETFKPTYSSYR